MIISRQAIAAFASLVSALTIFPITASAENGQPPNGASEGVDAKKDKNSDSDKGQNKERRRDKLQGSDSGGKLPGQKFEKRNFQTDSQPKSFGGNNPLDKALQKVKPTPNNPNFANDKLPTDTGKPFSKSRDFDNNTGDKTQNDRKLSGEAPDRDKPQAARTKTFGDKNFGDKNRDGSSKKPVVINPTPFDNGKKPNVTRDFQSPPTVGAEKTVPPGFGPPKKMPPLVDVKSFDELKKTRKEKTIAGGKGVVIEEADKRKIFKTNNTLVIQHDETERLRRVDPNARFEKGKGGATVSIIDRPGNVKIFTETDSNGQLLRRYRRGPDGRDVIIIDNRRRRNNIGKNIAIGAGIGLGVVAGAAILNSFVDVPPPRVRIPRERYIVDYEHASDDDVYEALSAPPIEDFRDRYTLDEIRATARLRDRMRRVDLDDINFEFGSFEVDPSQYNKLERIARAMQRVIDRNPNEVFLIEGYTDAVGSREDNLSLSDRRAESVAEVLSQQFRVPYENLTTQGYGEDYLKIQTDGPERINRRVAVRRITPLLSQGGPPPPPERRSDVRAPRAYDDRDDDQGSPPPPPGYDDRRGAARDDSYDNGADDRQDPDQQGYDHADDRGRDDQGSGGQYQYSPYRAGNAPN